MDKRSEEKKQRVLGALDKGMVQVHLDPRRPFVLVPPRFKEQAQLVLNISYRFDPADLTVNDWGIRETLSFGGERFTCGIPWPALFAVASMVTREFWMYPDDMPTEVMANAVEKYGGGEVRAKWPKGKDDDAPVPATKPKTVLREVVLERDDAAEAPKSSKPDDGGEPPQPPEPPKRGHLRLVK